MTTIACTRTHMAADTLAADAVSGPCHVRKIRPMVDIKERLHLAGGAGTLGDVMNALSWLQAFLLQKMDGYTGPEVDWENASLLVLRDDGAIMCFESACPYVILDGFAAIGSGSQAALAALTLEHTLHEAVLTATRVDHNSGGTVQVEAFPPTKGSASLKLAGAQ